MPTKRRRQRTSSLYFFKKLYYNINIIKRKEMIIMYNDGRLYSEYLFEDDITWCRDGKKCGNMDCFRNILNRADVPGIYSIAEMRETDVCPLYVLERREDK